MSIPLESLPLAEYSNKKEFSRLHPKNFIPIFWDKIVPLSEHARKSNHFCLTFQKIMTEHKGYLDAYKPLLKSFFTKANQTLKSWAHEKDEISMAVKKVQRYFDMCDFEYQSLCKRISLIGDHVNFLSKITERYEKDVIPKLKDMKSQFFTLSN
jgi:hypothetical protein